MSRGTDGRRAPRGEAIMGVIVGQRTAGSIESRRLHG
jgi:hypothetical protein